MWQISSKQTIVGVMHYPSMLHLCNAFTLCSAQVLTQPKRCSCYVWLHLGRHSMSWGERVMSLMALFHTLSSHGRRRSSQKRSCWSITESAQKRKNAFAEELSTGKWEDSHRKTSTSTFVVSQEHFCFLLVPCGILFAKSYQPFNTFFQQNAS